jgi:hypothetical protein
MKVITASEIKSGDYIICNLGKATSSGGIKRGKDGKFISTRLYCVRDYHSKKCLTKPISLYDARLEKNDFIKIDGYHRYEIKAWNMPKPSVSSVMIRGYVSEIEEAETDEQSVIQIKGSFIDINDNKLNSIQLVSTIRVLIL